MKKVLIIAVLIAGFAFTANAQEPEMVSITVQQARQALVDADTVKAQAEQIKTLTEAVNAQKLITADVKIEFARVSGEATALRQNEVANRAILEYAIKNTKKKRIALITIF